MAELNQPNYPYVYQPNHCHHVIENETIIVNCRLRYVHTILIQYTILTAKKISDKCAWAWVSMLSYFKKNVKKEK